MQNNTTKLILKRLRISRPFSQISNRSGIIRVGLDVKNKNDAKVMMEEEEQAKNKLRNISKSRALLTGEDDNSKEEDGGKQKAIEAFRKHNDSLTNDPEKIKSIVSMEEGNEKTLDKFAFVMEAGFEERVENITNVTTVEPKGFVINNRFVEGSVVITPGSCMKWIGGPPIEPSDALSWDFFEKEFRIEQLKLLKYITPKFDLVLVGTGKSSIPPSLKLKNELTEFLDGTQFDFVSSYHAASTYNVLSLEGRRVCAFLTAFDFKRMIIAPKRRTTV